MSTKKTRLSAEPFEVRWLGTTDYQEIFNLQHELAQRRANYLKGNTEPPPLGHDILLLQEHHSVYTAGRRTELGDRPTDGSAVIDVDRGGRITWHGPGQLVGYPIVALATPVDVVHYVRRIEQAIINLCNNFDLTAERVDGRSGVWLPATPELPARKIAAIGIRVEKGVALHGFALNCNPDLSAFSAIVPCGIPDAGVTSLTAELGRTMTVAEVVDSIPQLLTAALDGLELTTT